MFGSLLAMIAVQPAGNWKGHMIKTMFLNSPLKAAHTISAAAVFISLS
jgi:hypothetical protein